jgi:Fe/S biogenesis protein NfuA
MADSSPVLTITDKAKKRVLEIRSAEPEGDTLALWVEVVGAAAGEYSYDLYFDVPGEATADDTVQVTDDLTVVMPMESATLLEGATLDMSRDLLNPGLVVTNPNKPPVAPASPGINVPSPEELTGSVDERVRHILDTYVAPSIAAHGGTAELVGVEGNTAYLRLGGGCQGCGQAAATLSQGIKVAITQSVPEITEIVDVTDHANGTNPYFEPAS